MPVTLRDKLIQDLQSHHSGTHLTCLIWSDSDICPAIFYCLWVTHLFWRQKSSITKKSTHMNGYIWQQNGILSVLEACLNAALPPNIQAIHLKKSNWLEIYPAQRTLKIIPGVKLFQTHLLTAVLWTLFKDFKQLKWLKNKRYFINVFTKKVKPGQRWGDKEAR